MSQPVISKARWFWLVAVSLLFLHVFVFIQLPVSIYLESEALDSGQLPDIVMALLVLGLITWLGFGLIFGLLGWPLRKFVGPLLLALALSYWLIDSFTTRSYPALDGAITELPVDWVHGWIQLLVFLAILAAMLASRRKLETPVLVFLTILTALNVFWVVRSLVLLPKPANAAHQSITPDEFFTLSTQRNVLIILLDTFQSEYLEEVLAVRPELAEELQGFSYFPDTLGVATSTFMSIPAIHSGKAYDPSRTMAGYFNRSIRQESVLTRLGQSGYSAMLLNPIRNVCPDDTRCLHRDELLRSQLQSNLGAALHMLDISLMRSAPEPLKNSVFRQGAFLLSPLFSPASLGGDASVVWDDSRILAQYAQRLKVSNASPHVTFLHLMNTHPPYVLADDCQVLATPEHDRGSRASALQQTSCALTQLTDLVQALQAQGVYEQTMIAVLGDHGNSSVYADPSLFSLRLLDPAAAPEDAARLVGSANPLLLIKAFNAKGPLRHEQTLADLTDIPATICGALPECEWQTGIDLFAPANAGTRQRNFMNYRWEHKFWELGRIPELDFYTVTGPLSDWNSWQLEAGVRRHTIANLDFNLDDDPAAFGGGWGAVEISPQGNGIRWVVGHVAELFLPLQEDAGTAFAVQLNFEFWVPEFNPDQALRMEFNGHEYAKQPLPPGLHKIRYRISRDQLLAENNRIVLFFDALRQPNEQDVRELAVVVRSLIVEKIDLSK